MMRSVIYIAGMFEDGTNPLFLDIQALAKKLQESCKYIKLYSGTTFGSYSYQNEIRRINEIVSKSQPSLIIAHSLGCYISTHLPVLCPFILIDPSVSITDIILPNIKRGGYDDGTYTFKVSPSFLNSVKISEPIEVLVRNIKNTGHHIYIFGAGRGGYRIAEQYHQNLVGSIYFFLPNADHEFSNRSSRQRILQVIKKRLDAKQSSRSRGTRIKSS